MSRSVSVVGFPGGGTWPVWAGLQQGCFAAHGLQVDLEFTTNSVELFKNVMAGRYHVALTAFDNIVAYQEGQGEVQLPGTPDFFAFMGCDHGFLSLMAVPGIQDIASLRGRTVSVDAMTTGFAFVLREILARNDIGDGDVTYAAVGGGAMRLKALLEGRQEATLLNTPLDLIAEAAGAVRLGRADSVIGPYQGGVGMARRGWARDNPAVLRAFLRGYRDAVRWLYERDNRTTAESLLVAKAPGMTPALAARAYDVMLADTGGMSRDLGISPEGIDTVLALRSRYGQPGKVLTMRDCYLDMSYRTQALLSG